MLRKKAQLAGELLCAALKDDNDPFLPNIKSLLRDTTHAARRILERSFETSDEIKTILEHIVTSATSILQKIRRSDMFQEIYEQWVKELCTEFQVFVKNLSFALHRFDSVTSPLIRFVLTFDAVIQTAREIQIRRQGQGPESKDAEHFLIFISDPSGVRRCILVGMLADAGQQTQLLLRFWDTEHFDAAGINAAIQRFVHTVNVMFVKKQVGEIPMSYTSIMIKMMMQPRTLVVGNRSLEIGLQNPADLQKHLCACFEVLNAWVVVALGSLKAENPSHQLLRSYSVFNVREAVSQKDVHDHLSRLAKVYGEDRMSLSREFKAVFPVARQNAKAA